MTYIKYIGTTVRQETPSGKGGLVGPFTVEPGDVINVPADVAASLIATESTFWAATADPTTTSRHLSVIATQPPTIAVAAGAGTSPPAPVLAGNDTKGSITWGTGTSVATGAQVTVTFYTAYATGTTPRVVISPANAAAAALLPYVVQQGQTGFQVALQAAPTASQAATVYAVTYHAIG